MELWREELYHHGIKGQKWGERNYQYKDGSLTPAGKIRYGTASDNTVGYKEAVKASQSKKQLSTWEIDRHKKAIANANSAELNSYDKNESVINQQYKTAKRQIKADKKSGTITRQEAKAAKKEAFKKWWNDSAKNDDAYNAQIEKNKQIVDNLMARVDKKTVLQDKLMNVGINALDRLLDS